MALSASSILHYWSARYGSTPVYGGKPVFTRSSAARIADQRGVLQAPIINTPRTGWDTISGERRPTMLLEMARTNLILHSTAFDNAAWSKTSATITTGRPDPAGGTTACTITATASPGIATQSLGAGASAVRRNSMWVRRTAGTGTVTLLTADGAVDTTIVPTADWVRYSSAVRPANTARWSGIKLATNGNAVEVWNGQLEEGSFITSDIPTTTAAVTRSADSLYWDYIHAPQEKMAYVRFVESGSISNASSGIFAISAAALSVPVLRVFRETGGYFAEHWNGVSTVATAELASPVVGDTVELLLVMLSTGSIQLIQSINGAAVTSTAATGVLALATAWGGPRLWLNSVASAAYAGSNRFAEVKLVKYADVVATTAQTRMEELRAFEVDAAGRVIS